MYNIYTKCVFPIIYKKSYKLVLWKPSCYKKTYIQYGQTPCYCNNKSENSCK